MLRIGLTGGIGAGKTTACRLFARLGIPVVDADEVARRLSEPGQPGHQAICAHFGATILDQRGAIDRAKLRQRVFADPQQRRELEALIHPLVFAAIEQAVTGLDAPYCILAVPLLLETGYRDRVHRVLVVDVPESVQYERVRARDGLNDGQIAAILKAQCGRQDRLAAADDVLHNDVDQAQLEEQVQRLHRRYLALCPHGPRGRPSDSQDC